MELYTLHLFAGCGGGILADLLLGHRTIGAVEIERYPREVLLSRQLDGSLPRFPIWDDVRTFSSDNPDTAEYIIRLRSISQRLCICGGFPCQDISCAGKGAGIEGEHSGLWREYARIISEVRPRFAFVENSPMLVRRGLHVVLQDLTSMGYDARWGVVSAADVGARHRRKRLWILAYTACQRREAYRKRGATQTKDNTIECAGDVIPNTGNDGIKQRFGQLQEDKSTCQGSDYHGSGATVNAQRERRKTQPGLGRIPDGLSGWMDDNKSGTYWTDDERGIPRLSVKAKDRANRLKAIGNAQVPLCAAEAFDILLGLFKENNYEE